VEQFISALQRFGIGRLAAIIGVSAGVAAALAAAQNIQPRAVNIRTLQETLLSQGVYLRPQSAHVDQAETV
jgi:homoserine acetyltransferase